MKSIGVPALACCLLIGSGCSVKENRMECPCRLVLDMTAVDTLTVKEADMYVSAANGFAFKDVLDSNRFGTTYEVSVPKGQAKVWVYAGSENLAGPDGLSIPYGQDCPEIYMHFSEVDASGEYVREDIVLRKNFCTLSILVDEGKSFDHQIAVRGNVSGYDSSGSPFPGEFLCNVSFDGRNECRINIPRQTDSSLKMEVADGEKVLRVFAIGEYLDAAGYDWEAQDLKDMTLMLDYALTGVSIRMEGWDEEFQFNVTI